MSKELRYGDETKPTDKERRYGDNGTIHHTSVVNIERDPETGEVVSVWFRCATLPFTDHVVDAERANSMRDSYKEHKPYKIKAVVFE